MIQSISNNFRDDVHVHRDDEELLSSSERVCIACPGPICKIHAASTNFDPGNRHTSPYDLPKIRSSIGKQDVPKGYHCEFTSGPPVPHISAFRGRLREMVRALLDSEREVQYHLKELGGWNSIPLYLGQPSNFLVLSTREIHRRTYFVCRNILVPYLTSCFRDGTD